LTEYLSKVAKHVTAEFPGQQGQGQWYRPNVAAVHVSDDTATIEMVNGQTICNGVDITDKVRKYPPNEWNTLPWNLRQEIMDAKQSQGGGRSQRGRGKGGRGGGKSVSSVMTEEGVEDLIQRTTQATIASLTATTDNVSVITTPTAINANANVTGDATKRTRSAMLQGALKRFKPAVGKVQATNVQHIDQAGPQVHLLSAISRESATHTIGYFDEDSHADMHCAGKNCVMLSTMGYSCDVSPFHNQYEVRKDVEIVKLATAYQHSNGHVTYLVMNISLWFGDEMEHSLFNGLVARDAGNRLCTDPYDDKILGFDLQQVIDGQDHRIVMERRGGVRTFKPLHDDVLRAIEADSPNVVYLNPESEYPPITTDQDISALWLEGDNAHALETDLRPKITNMPLDVNGYYHNASAASNEAPLFWPHQIYNIAASMIRDVRYTIATTANQIQAGHQTQEYSYPGICAIATKSPHQGPITPETLQQLWGIGHETAMHTIGTTTQYAMRHVTQPL
jgi:hypothetical protein